MRLWEIWDLLRESIAEWQEDDAPLIAAALAYYGLFAFVPFFILALIFINSLFQHGFLGTYIVRLIQETAIQQMPNVASELIEWAGKQATSFHITAMSLMLLILGAGGLFVQTKKAFHIIWKLPTEGRPLRNAVLSYLRSFLLIGIVALMLLATSAFSAILVPAGKYIEKLCRSI